MTPRHMYRVRNDMTINVVPRLVEGIQEHMYKVRDNMTIYVVPVEAKD